MQEKLEKFHERYLELQRLLADSEVLSNRELYQKYAKELSEITPITNKYIEYKELKKQLVELEGLLSSKDEDEELRELARAEYEEISFRKSELESQIEEFFVKKSPEDNKDVIVEIRAGTGGQEASLFAADLYRMYVKYAENCGFKVETLNTNTTEAGGFKEVIFSIIGSGAYGKFKYESGTHRVQRVPATETSGRTHTSAVTVAVLQEAEDVELQIDPKELQIDVYRSSGPGGQGVNTTDSAVRITHLPTGLVVTCQDERSQLKNKAKGLRVLRARLLEKQKEEQRQKISSERKSQIGTGDRSQKIRTYNFSERRVTDHRIKLTLHKLDRILEGELEEIVEALRESERKGTGE